MKRLLTLSRVLFTAAALMLVAGAASAQGLNLSWTECGATGELQRNFACASNTGTNAMVGSIVIGSPMAELNGHEGVLDLQTNQAALSAWWTIGSSPNCRAVTALTVSFDFTAASACVDPWGNAGFGGVNYVGNFEGRPNRARIRTVYAINPSASVTGTDEYYVFKISINNSRTTGTGSCAGCADGACIVFNSSKMTQPAILADDRIITGISARRHILWQAGGGTIGGAGCPNEVPAKQQTWGAVKSLYR